jgi:hypothetical protein
MSRRQPEPRRRPHAPGIRWPLRLAASGVLALLLCGPALGGSPRSLALGGGDHLEDARAVTRWPGSLGDYAGRSWLASGRFNAAGGWRDGRDARDIRLSGPEAGLLTPLTAADGAPVVGLALSDQAADADPGSMTRDHPGHAVTVLGGVESGGAHLAALWRTVGGGVGGGEPGRRRDDLGLGLRAELSAGAYLDLAGDVRLRREEFVLAGPDGATPTVRSAYSDASWSVRARLFADVGGGMVAAPSAEFVRERFTGPVWGEHPAGDQAWANDGQVVRLGLGLLHLPDPDRMGLVALEYVAGRATHAGLAAGGPTGDDVREDYTAVTATIAGETRRCWWLSLRGSLARRYVDDKGTLPGPADGGQWLAGAGGTIHLGPWGLDLGASNREPRGLAAYSDFRPGAADRLWLELQLHHDF